MSFPGLVLPLVGTSMGKAGGCLLARSDTCWWGQVQDRALHPGLRGGGWAAGRFNGRKSGGGDSTARTQKHRAQGGLESVTGWMFRALKRRVEMSSLSYWLSQASTQKLAFLCD